MRGDQKVAFMTDAPSLDVGRVLQEFQDFLAPKLDCYEQAIYLYLFRHSRLHGKAEVVVGFKSARKRMALARRCPKEPATRSYGLLSARGVYTFQVVSETARE